MTSKRVLTAVSMLFVLAMLAACGGGGGGGGDSATAPPPNNVPRFAYVANFSDNTVSIYTVNAATGQLRHNGYVAAGTNPSSVTVDPSGKFAYVTNSFNGTGGNSVPAYSINATTGALTRIDADGTLAGIQNFPAGSGPRAVSVDPAGKFAYVANNGGGVSAYTINATTGALTAVAGSPFTAGTIPRSVTTTGTIQ